jgi:hypothetical protein
MAYRGGIVMAASWRHEKHISGDGIAGEERLARQLAAKA